ncbi:lppg:fo 2-phospho-l-lactate transferase [Diaporthe amygdali]|uniref:lppg:fo 2-phospho-l-lactate transferase n=1 Tax=Phomopsis amygdali TaxID=1214568 RepID=UPI0022FE4301|nr:lppg:fo 2-phospho-l-lactate transferase [Diaporthe amygdali]KAJ0119322.1 lppg:fo 2-phospho-l-lactate transferase [Diaporthe amygdali]
MSNTPHSLNPPTSTPRPLTPPPASPYPPTRRHPERGGIAVFSGGTAANFLVDVFDRITTKKKCPLRYIIPISDNGGSSSELIRVFGGPSVGDVRSRLVRLIPNHNGDEERTALKTLFEYRLSADPMTARSEWLDIVEARHILWTFIPSQQRELIRSVFNNLNLEIVKRNRPTSVFNFAEASVGNLFLTGARLFSGSFESAIYLLSLICAIPESTAVLPAINSNFTHHISAGLVDGSVLAGQVAISHPSGPTAVPDDTFQPTGNKHLDLDRVEDANLPGSLPVLRGHHAFSKDEEEDLACRIGRVWYINPYGHEIWPVANPKVLEALEDSETVVYSIGSLYTSIIPSVILRGVGAAVAGGGVKNKVLILNSKTDRETGPAASPMTAADFARAVAKAAKESQTDFGSLGEGEISRYVTHIVYLEGAEVGAPGMPRVNVDELARLGIKCVKVKGLVEGEGKRRIVRYEETGLVEALEGIIG